MRIGQILGVVLRINPFFLLLLVAAGAVGKIIPVALLFALVIWHETAHTLAASYHGLRIGEIELLPFGGVAKVSHPLELKPKIEARVAVAGPLSNMALVFFLWLIHSFRPLDPHWYAFLIRANINMAAVNLLPALPLDGGRILRGKLAGKYGLRSGTHKAVAIGQIIAGLLIGLGLAGFLAFDRNTALIYVVLGIFIFLASAKEKQNAAYAFIRFVVRKNQEIREEKVLPARQLVATADASIGDVLHRFIPSHYHVIWIVDLAGDLIGFVTEAQLLNSLPENGIHDKINKLVKHRL